MILRFSFKQIGNNQFLPLILFIFHFSFFTFFTACHSEKEIAKKKSVSHQKSNFLIEQLKKNEFNFEWLSSKASINILLDGKKTSFKANIRIRKDSAIWLSFSPALGIEAARVIISKDSVKFINRIDKLYFTGDFYFLNDMFQADCDYDMLQSLIIGNSISFDEQEKYKTSVDRKNEMYLISSFKKRKLRKAIEKDKSKRKKFDEVIYSIWLEPKYYKIKQLAINNFRTKKSLMVKYSEFKIVDEQQFPYNASFNIKAQKNILIHADYTRVHINKLQKFPFKIPSKYKRVY